MSPYVLTTAAEADLREIIRRTRKLWGEAQVRRYVARLEHGFMRLARDEAPIRDMSAIYPGLRMARCEHHYIFALPRAGGPTLIVAIFHERMDVTTHLAGRIETK